MNFDLSGMNRMEKPGQILLFSAEIKEKVNKFDVDNFQD